MSTKSLFETSYEKVFKSLHKYRVRYLVVGGVALNLYQVNRFTADLDIMVDFDKKNVINLVKALTKLKYRPRVPVDAIGLGDKKTRESWIKDKNAVVFTFDSTNSISPSIDVFISHPINFDQAYKERRTIQGGSFNIQLVSPKHLLKLKKLAGREKDKMDIKNLKNQLEI